VGYDQTAAVLLRWGVHGMAVVVEAPQHPANGLAYGNVLGEWLMLT
jgi:hypothetical protein